MKNPAQQVFKYGETVWSNMEMDELRKSECLCLNCASLKGCPMAKDLFEICRHCNMALAVTRCLHYKAK